MRRWLCSGIAALALITAVHAMEDAPEIAAHAAILVHADSGSVLYEKNADERMLIASTTKIMTALIVLDSCALDECVTIRPSACAVEGSSTYLTAGEQRSVEELLYGMLLSSGNDAATALAEHVSGSSSGFAALMNAYALRMGLENTHFVNPHGLDAESQYSSAADLAKLSSAAMANDTFRRIVSSKRQAFGNRIYANHNKLLWRYDGCIGVKTGYTKAAGRCLVSCAERDGMRLICVTLSDPQDWADHTSLLEWGYSNWRLMELEPQNTMISIPVISGEKASVTVGLSEPTRILAHRDSVLRYEYELPPAVYAGIVAGERAGVLRVYSGETELDSKSLVFTETVPINGAMRLTLWEKLRRGLEISVRYGGVLDPGFVYSSADRA